MALIPFVDLATEWHPIKDDVCARILRVFEHGQFIMGPEVIELEQRLAEDVGVSFAMTCSSGTTALQMALMAIGIGPGDEVILPAFTFAAPLEVVLLLGARPILADIDPITYCIDINSVRKLVTARTKTIIAVSLYGQPADFEQLNQLAKLRDITVIEDAAQSYGATLNDRRSGGLSSIGCTSFFPTKPLGGPGDGGAIFTDNPNFANRIKEIRDHGQSGKYQHVRLGINGRLDTITCAALLPRLNGIDVAIARRQSIARHYDELLHNAARLGWVKPPIVRDKITSAYAQYAIQVENREHVMTVMRESQIQVAIHYPTPLHHQPAFRDHVSYDQLPHTENISKHILCLPIYPALTLEQQTRTATTLIGALAETVIR
ncbi:MAG: DegT/DnrJ/EryC1/StrS family aminotransferase [Pseudomonadota bacterium]